MTTRRVYPRPPIVEAIIDFRFPTEVGGDVLLDALRAALGDQYGGEQRTQKVMQVKASFKDGSASASATSAPHVTFMASGDGQRLVGCGDGMLSVHALAPYPGWESFSEQARDVMAAVAELIGEHGLHQVAVRYIDRISLPVGEDVTFNDLLTAMPPRPDAMPEQLTGFHFVTQTVDPESGIWTALTLASTSPDEGGLPVALYDLVVRQDGEPLCGVAEEEWRPVVEALHHLQRDIFEGSITEQLRETFQ